MSSCLSITALYGSYLRRCLSGAGLTSKTINIDDETTMHLWCPNPADSLANSKPSLILIHGFGPQGVWQWRPQIVSFAPHFNLYIPDLVFFGESSTKSDERSEVFQAACVGKLLEKLGVNEYSVLGTSYGGFVAYNVALMFPEKVKKVVIASSGVNMKKKDQGELLKRANVEKIEELMLPETANHLRTLLKLTVSRSVGFMPDFLLNDFIQKLYVDNRNEKMELLKGLSLGRSDIVTVSPLQQEVLIVWGVNDQIFLLEKAYELEKMLGKKVKLHVIKNSSHMPQIEEAGEFNKVVKSFLLA